MGYLSSLMEGFAAPIADTATALFLYAIGLISTAVGASNITNPIFALIGIIGLVVAFATGYDDPDNSAFYVVGAIVGLLIYGGAIIAALPSGVNIGTWTVVILTILGIGARVAGTVVSSNQGSGDHSGSGGGRTVHFGDGRTVTFRN